MYSGNDDLASLGQRIMPTTFRSRLAFFSQRPWILSVVILTLLIAWLVSGEEVNQQPPSEQKKAIPLAKVSYQTFSATDVARIISLYGRTAPDRDANIGAEVAGKVTELKVEKGQSVREGQVIAVIDKADRAAQLQRARSLLSVRQKEYAAAQSLKKKGLQGEVAFSQAEANLAEARASVTNFQLDLANTEVKAPFAGTVDNLHIEVGDYVGIGDPVAYIIDLDPLIVKADVSERHIDQIDANIPAEVVLVSGQKVEGRLRYQSSVASSTTNTFSIELEIDNPDQKLPAGISAEVSLPLDIQRAVKLAPSMLALDEQGNLGVKTLEGDHVRFVGIKLVKAEQDGVWLSGLGDSVDIITVGQGFVRDGDQVDAIVAGQ